MRAIYKGLKYILLIFCLLFLLFTAPIPTKKSEKIEWGIVFSQKQAQLLRLDWKKLFLEILDDFKIKSVKIILHWDMVEPENNRFRFEDLDWQIKRAKEKNIKLILVVGAKTGRWPECHVPDWASNLSKEQFQNELFNYIETVIERYKKEEIIWAWQIENEPFFKFGKCPGFLKDLLREEVLLVKGIDSRPIIITESGEFSPWVLGALYGDIVGVSIYRNVYFEKINRYITYPFSPFYYFAKSKLIFAIFKKQIINTELQGEPWCKDPLFLCEQKEQEKTMNVQQFRKIINFAKHTGLDTFFLWGVEWWYYQKERGNVEILKEAMLLLNQ